MRLEEKSIYQLVKIARTHRWPWVSNPAKAEIQFRQSGKPKRCTLTNKKQRELGLKPKLAFTT